MGNYNTEDLVMPTQKEYTPEEMMKLANPKLKKAVAKLVLNQEITPAELALLASHTMFELATVAIHFTEEKLMSLQNPIAILSTVTAMNSNMTPSKDNVPFQNYQKNMMAIQEIQNKDSLEKGPTR